MKERQRKKALTSPRLRMSGKILDWALCENMEGIKIELLVARVKEKYPEAKARIIHDNGKQLTGLNGGATNGSGTQKSF